jgi:mono/diheme cytochrome c family protein
MQRMSKRHILPALGLIVLSLQACTGPETLPVGGQTPIPTLVPVTEAGSLLNPTATQQQVALTYPSGIPSAESGQTIYEANCAKCHGDNGKGAVTGARDFTDADFVRGESPASFFQTVSDGRGEMPAFKASLAVDDRWNAVFYVWRFSTSDQTLVQGKKIFTDNCAACHGANGTGAVLGAADFTNMPQIAGGAPRDFYQIVTQGKGSMPSWQGRLSQDDRWAVIDFVRTFSYDPTLGEGAAATEIEPTQAATAAVCDESQTNPFKWDDVAAISAGQSLYVQKCGACHGTNGKGLLPGMPDFSAAGSKQDVKDTSGELFCTIRNGRGAMPSWSGTLSPEQMWQALTYIASLSK